MGTALLIIFLFGVVGFASLIGVLSLYNGLASARTASQLAFSQMEGFLTRRHEFTATLVERAKVYLKPERPVLEALLVSRNQACAALTEVIANPQTIEAVIAHLHAEEGMERMLERLKLVSQAYPEFKVSRGIQLVSRELDLVGERITALRQAYNEAAQGFNAQRKAFPSILLARFLGLREIPLIEFPKPEEPENEIPAIEAGQSSTVFYG